MNTILNNSTNVCTSIYMEIPLNEITEKNKINETIYIDIKSPNNNNNINNNINEKTPSNNVFNPINNNDEIKHSNSFHLSRPKRTYSGSSIHSLSKIKKIDSNTSHSRNQSNHSIHSKYHSHSHSHSHHKIVNKEIAALSFLQSITMKSESINMNILDNNNNSKINSNETIDNNNNKMNQTQSSIANKNNNNINIMNNNIENNTLNNDIYNNNGYLYTKMVGHENFVAGRRLPGPECKKITIPSLFRYRIHTKYPIESAVVRRWEASVLREGIFDGRMYLSVSKGYPIAVSSVLKYDASDVLKKKKSMISECKLEEIINNNNLNNKKFDWRGKSYFNLLHSTWSNCDSERDARDEHMPTPEYSPDYLDDPTFKQGKHRHVLRGDKNIGPILSSVLSFVRPKELKEDLNKQFKETHTWMDPELTLSKIRNLKQEILMTCHKLELEISTAALACVYYEKLILQKFVSKANRKLIMSVCFILAFKFNEPLCSSDMTIKLKMLLQEFDRLHSIPIIEILEAEMIIYSRLSFSLHIPLREFQLHFSRLLKVIENSPRKYVGDEIYELYTDQLMQEDTLYNKNHLSFINENETEDEDDENENNTLYIENKINNYNIDSHLDSNHYNNNVNKRKNSREKSEYDPLNNFFDWKNSSLAVWWKKQKENIL